MSEFPYGLLLAQFWQFTLVATVALLLVRYPGADRPRTSAALLLVVLLKALVPPLWANPFGLFDGLAVLSPPAVIADSSEPTAAMRPAPVGEAKGVVDPPAHGSGEFDRWSSDDILDAIAPHETAETSPRAESPVTTTIADTARGELVPTPGEVTPAVVPVESPARTNRTTLRDRVWTIVVGLWVAGLIGLLVLSLRAWRRLAAAERLAVPIDPATKRLFDRLCDELSIASARLVVTTRPIGPCVVGPVRPRVLLPRCVVERSGPDDLEPILVHELMHLRRGDHWVGTLQFVVQALWWFHPLAWWTNRALTREIERCCDEDSVRFLSTPPAAYARSLVAVLQWKRELESVPVGLGVRPVDVTANRLERIMTLNTDHPRRRRWAVRLLLILAAVAVLPGAMNEPDTNRANADDAQEDAAGDATPGEERPEARVDARTGDKPADVEEPRADGDPAGRSNAGSIASADETTDGSVESSVQVGWQGPEGLRLSWRTETDDLWSSPALAPARQNLPVGRVQLRITSIPDRPKLEPTSTLTLHATGPATAAYVAHNAIPLTLTDEDFEQVAAGRLLMKVIFLPDAGRQPALVIPETIVSSRLAPGIDPVVEAERRGSVLAVLTLGPPAGETTKPSGDDLLSDLIGGALPKASRPKVEDMLNQWASTVPHDRPFARGFVRLRYDHRKKTVSRSYGLFEIELHHVEPEHTLGFSSTKYRVGLPAAGFSKTAVEHDVMELGDYEGIEDTPVSFITVGRSLTIVRPGPDTRRTLDVEQTLILQSTRLLQLGCLPPLIRENGDWRVTEFGARVRLEATFENPALSSRIERVRVLLDADSGRPLATSLLLTNGTETLHTAFDWQPRRHPAEDDRDHSALSGDDPGALLGLELAPVSAARRRMLGDRYRGGLAVTGVRPGGEAAKQGIRKGDVLVGLGRWETESLADVAHVLERSGSDAVTPLKFHVVRNGETMFGTLRLHEVLSELSSAGPGVTPPTAKRSTVAVEPKTAPDTRRGELLVFDATWNGPGRALRPVLQRWEQAGEPITHVDIDRSPDLTRHLKVDAVPTYLLRIEGKEVERIVGVASEKRLRALLDRIPDPNALRPKHESDEP